ncbi:MAG TPA: hypothetical protein VN611_12265 [Patescibacteria group bacterium]|nr:hypothetical protein [Patescibacteria group bacterium]
MKMAEMMLLVGGIYHVAFAFFHLMFWRFRFINWREELPKMSALNRAIMQMFNVAVIVFMILVAYISLRYSQELTTTDLGRDLLLGVAVFWLARLGGEFVLKEGLPAKPGIVAACVLGILLYVTPVIVYLKP